MNDEKQNMKPIDPEELPNEPAAIRRFLPRIVGLAGCLSAAGPVLAAPGRADKPSIPDFTQGGKRDESHDWNPGPTGARGWVFGRNGQTADARQNLVTAVDAGSPADGVPRADDVILGVEGKPFAEDSRRSLARAITAAGEEHRKCTGWDCTGAYLSA